MSNLTPEDLAQARREEAAIAKKHERAAKQEATRQKNKELYERSPKSESGFVFINRQCREHDNPADHTLTSALADITYMQVQLFQNDKPGVAKYVLKLEWSTHSNPDKAMSKRYQRKTYFNLYMGYQVKTRVKERFGIEAACDYYGMIKAINKELKLENHPAPEAMFGFCTVQQQKHGTHTFAEHQANFVPGVSAEGKNIACVRFVIDGVDFDVVMHDVSTRGERQEKAAIMAGYKRTLPVEEELAIIKTTLERLRNGKQQTT